MQTYSLNPPQVKGMSVLRNNSTLPLSSLWSTAWRVVIYTREQSICMLGCAHQVVESYPIGDTTKIWYPLHSNADIGSVTDFKGEVRRVKPPTAVIITPRQSSYECWSSNCVTRSEGDRNAAHTKNAAGDVVANHTPPAVSDCVSVAVLYQRIKCSTGGIGGMPQCRASCKEDQSRRQGGKL